MLIILERTIPLDTPVTTVLNKIWNLRKTLSLDPSEFRTGQLEGGMGVTK